MELGYQTRSHTLDGTNLILNIVVYLRKYIKVSKTSWSYSLDRTALKNELIRRFTMFQ